MCTKKCTPMQDEKKVVSDVVNPGRLSFFVCDARGKYMI